MELRNPVFNTLPASVSQQFLLPGLEVRPPLNNFNDYNNHGTTGFTNTQKDIVETKQNLNVKEQYEKLETHINEMEKRVDDKQIMYDLKKYAILMIPFFIYPRHVAAYFALSEIVQLYLEKLGADAEGTLLFLFVLHGVDAAALRKGRLRLVDGFKNNWWNDIYDYALTKAGANDFMRLGSAMFLKQTGKPEYKTYQ